MNDDLEKTSCEIMKIAHERCVIWTEKQGKRLRHVKEKMKMHKVKFSGIGSVLQ